MLDILSQRSSSVLRVWSHTISIAITGNIGVWATSTTLIMDMESSWLRVEENQGGVWTQVLGQAICSVPPVWTNPMLSSPL